MSEVEDWHGQHSEKLSEILADGADEARKDHCRPRASSDNSEPLMGGRSDQWLAFEITE